MGGWEVVLGATGVVLLVDDEPEAGVLSDPGVTGKPDIPEPLGTVPFAALPVVVEVDECADAGCWRAATSANRTEAAAAPPPITRVAVRSDRVATSRRSGARRVAFTPISRRWRRSTPVHRSLAGGAGRRR